MGYASYNLPDGREAGYAVEATCDHPGCSEAINRGLGYLCGERPDGHRDPEEPGCGQYFCGKHMADYSHGCANPRCSVWDSDENEMCTLAKDHEGKHLSDSASWEDV